MVSKALTTVARRPRDVVRNDPDASRIVDLWTGNAVGAGITTRWPDRHHADAWRHGAASTACDAEGRRLGRRDHRLIAEIRRAAPGLG
jgi:hypothetical protein